MNIQRIEVKLTMINPLTLKITDMEICKLKDVPMQCSIIRIKTNQGIIGFGEIRDFASIKYCMMLKRQLIGQNPCNILQLFSQIKQFGGHGRQGGGVSGVEVALVDLTGKAYGIPAYQLLGGKQREKIRVYCDTDVEGKHSGKEMGEALKKRIDSGFTMVKMDLGIDMLLDIDGTLNIPVDYLKQMRNLSSEERSFGFSEGRLIPLMNIPHPFSFISITEKGFDILEEYIRQVRETIGYSIPLAIDHIGHVNVETCIKLGKRLEKYNIAWMEDCVPWFYTDQLQRLKNSVSIPICTGEDIYLKENFRPLIEKKAVSVIHPDVLTAGGMFETRRIISEAEDAGIATVIHMAESPVGCMAAAHVAAASGKNFVAMEYHSFDVSWWDSIVKNYEQKIVCDGWIKVNNKPGLGIEDLDDDVLKEHAILENGKLWISTEDWDNDWSHDRIWS